MKFLWNFANEEEINNRATIDLADFADQGSSETVYR
jgi:hypothetical protein